jgi:YebC/PmpR family DNA-binding regulatory protein
VSGHSKWSSIKHKKGAADAKRGKLFSKLTRAIIVAAKEGGPDPAANLALQNAVEKARSYSMPKDNIDRAIAKGTGSGADQDAFEAIVYEGYGPEGVAVIAEALTDNRNRTASDLRAAFTKAGGSLGESNSVSFMFDRLGEVIYPSKVATADAMFEAAVEAGADNVESGAEQHTITCATDDLNAVRDALEQRFGPAQSAKLVWRPKTAAPVAGDDADTLLKLLETLEDSDDVQSVYANFEMADDVLQRLSA